MSLQQIHPSSDWGARIGDALAMPAHWYYNTERLEKDYGFVDRYLAPQNPHPDSILWRSHYQAPNEKGEILHDQAPYWGKRGIHYHQFLQPGENTVNLQLNELLQVSLEECGDYDEEDFLGRYIDFMTTPGRHRDTYLEEYHRNFFMNYARGEKLSRCATEEKHIGGLCCLFPILDFFHNDFAQAREAGKRRLKSTHPGLKMEAAADLIFAVLEGLQAGRSLPQSVEQVVSRQAHPCLGIPWKRLLDLPTREALTRGIGTVCYVDYAVPAVLYLAWKHGDDPETALVENAMAGGDNCYRGAVLGGLLWAAHGAGSFPEPWLKDLKTPPVAPDQGLKGKETSSVGESGFKRS